MSHRSYGRGLGRPLLDIASYARSGPNGGRRLTHPEMAFIARTVRRTPEVMVKVLSTSAKGVGGVQRHFEYLIRKGELELETDDGRYITVGEIKNLVTDDWDLDLEESRPQSHLAARKNAASPKLVH